MAWTNIPDDVLEPGKPIRSVDAIALRDNPIAIAQGLAGAPRILTAALFPPSAGSAHIIMRLQESEASTIHSDYSATGEQNRHNSGRHLGVTVLVPGVIRCRLLHRSSVGSNSAEVRVLRNGAVVQTWSNSSNGNVERIVDVAVNVGDAIIFQLRSSSINGEASFWSGLRILSATPNMAVA